VNGVGEIDGRCAVRHFDQIAFGREDVDLILEQFELGVFPEILGALFLLKNFEKLAQPAVFLADPASRAFAPVL
jgi:hypothetical protein